VENIEDVITMFTSESGRPLVNLMRGGDEARPSNTGAHVTLMCI
jgi:hypothetical protein